MASSFSRFLDHTQWAPQSVGLLWTRDQLIAETSTWQHTTLTTNRHPCPWRDSNPHLSRQAAADLWLRPHGHWDWQHMHILYKNICILYILTHSMEESPSSEAVFQLVKKFPAFYGTQRFITTFTSACHMSLSWANLIQTKPPQSTSWRSILILSSNYAWVSQVVSFPQVSPPKPCLHLSYSP